MPPAEVLWWSSIAECIHNGSESEYRGLVVDFALGCNLTSATHGRTGDGFQGVQPSHWKQLQRGEWQQRSDHVQTTVSMARFPGEYFQLLAHFAALSTMLPCNVTCLQARRMNEQQNRFFFFSPHIHCIHRDTRQRRSKKCETIFGEVPLTFQQL